MNKYIELTKPGIIMGNAITATAGFFLASQGAFDISLFLAMLIGLSLIIGSGCVFNNYIDRHIDAKMTRTKHRPLAAKTISVLSALTIGCVLFALGSVILFLLVNVLTLTIAWAGFFVYVAFYSVAKHHTTLATQIGAIAGSVPPVVGYCAVTAHLDMAALLLFLIVTLWQMPHFYAIALYRLDEYAAASVPVLPVVKGIQTTKVHMFLYILLLIPVTLLLTWLNYTGYAYLIAACVLGATWLIFSFKGLKKQQSESRWARMMFLFSLVFITLLCAFVSIDTQF